MSDIKSNVVENWQEQLLQLNTCDSCRLAVAFYDYPQLMWDRWQNGAEMLWLISNNGMRYRSVVGEYAMSFIHFFSCRRAIELYALGTGNNTLSYVLTKIARYLLSGIKKARDIDQHIEDLQMLSSMLQTECSELLQLDNRHYRAAAYASKAVIATIKMLPDNIRSNVSIVSPLRYVSIAFDTLNRSSVFGTIESQYQAGIIRQYIPLHPTIRPKEL